MNRISRLAHLPMRPGLAGLATTLLVSGGLGLAGLGLAAGTVQAQPSPAPQSTSQWCPGQYVSKFIQNMQWDWNVCHDWHLVDNSEPDEYGVTHFHAEEGPEPPSPPPIFHTKDECMRAVGFICVFAPG